MTQLRIDLTKLTHNFTTIKGQLDASTKMMSVVKADAYGHGATTIAKHLINLGTDWLAVAYAQEGVSLRKAGIKCPIIVFYPQYESIDTIIEHKLEPALYSSSFLTAFAKALGKYKQNLYPVHLKCNTGLNRIGLSDEDLDHFLSKKHDYPFQLKSVYSHLGASENPRPCHFTQKQITAFLSIKEKVKRLIPALPYFIY